MGAEGFSLPRGTVVYHAHGHRLEIWVARLGVSYTASLAAESSWRARTKDLTELYL